MALSISSSEADAPGLNWTWVWGIAMFMCLAYVGTTEAYFFEKGFVPTVNDSKDLWLKQRERATKLGDRALILVGASRIQLGLDLHVLREKTGLEPVQLAIDGSSYAPVLNGLAMDTAIRGTIILDLMPGPVSMDTQSTGISKHYQEAYEALASKNFQWASYETSEVWLADAIRGKLINYANGGRPWDALANRVFNEKSTPQYLETFADRSRKADYQLVPMPDFYLNRVLRHIGNPPELMAHQQQAELHARLKDYIAHLQPAPESVQSQKGLADLERVVSIIQARGGRVIILAMPTSGLVQSADAKRFPRQLYWDKVVASTTAQTIQAQDHEELSGFNCPDGSHLDARDTTAFTNAFILLAGLNRSQK